MTVKVCIFTVLKNAHIS